MIGGSGLFRYHVTLNHRIVPYFQVGFGGLLVWSCVMALAGTEPAVYSVISKISK